MPDKKLNNPKLENLTRYPAGERALTGTAAIFMSLLSGGSTTITLILAATSLNIITILGLALGSVVFAIKTVRNVYKKNQEETRLTQKVVKETKWILAKILSSNSHLKFGLNTSLELLKENQLTPTQIQKLYTYVDELAKCVAKLPIKKIEQDKLKSDFNAIKEEIKANTPLILPNGRYRQIQYKPQSIDNTQNKGSSIIGNIWAWIKKTGNRTLSFVGGASIAVSTGIGITTIAFGISNPVGWVLIGIFAAAVVVGIASVAIDYVLSRKQDEKINQLTQCEGDLVEINRGIREISKEMGHINTKHLTPNSNHLINEKLDIKPSVRDIPRSEQLPQISEPASQANTSMEQVPASKPAASYTPFRKG